MIVLTGNLKPFLLSLCLMTLTPLRFLTKNSQSLFLGRSTNQLSVEHMFSRKKKSDASLILEGKQNGNKVDGEEISSKRKDPQGGDDSVWLVSSDSEPPSHGLIRHQRIVSTEKDEDFVIQAKVEEPAVKKAPKKNSLNKMPSRVRQTPKKENSKQESLKREDKDTDAIVAEEVTTDKNIKPSSSSSSRLPLVLSEKVNRTKVLVECEGDSIDLSGDMGAGGRVVVSDTTEDVYWDLKGTMEGFSFDSGDEANKNAKTASKPADQSGGTEEVTNTKAKAQGEIVLGKKRGRPSKEKQQPAKKSRNSVPKKAKPKK